MTTKELIAELQKADPEGECLVVTAGSGAIAYLDQEPSYWDGPASIVLRDEEDYVSGIKLTKSGYKIVIHSLWLDDLLFDEPDATVEYDYDPDGYEKKREEVYRKFGREMQEWADGGCKGEAPKLEKGY